MFFECNDGCRCARPILRGECVAGALRWCHGRPSPALGGTVASPCPLSPYGAKLVPLSAKGQTAVELSSANELVKTLEVLKAAVQSGELDTALEAASSSVRAGFKK